MAEDQRRRRRAREGAGSTDELANAVRRGAIACDAGARAACGGVEQRLAAHHHRLVLVPEAPIQRGVRVGGAIANRGVDAGDVERDRDRGRRRADGRELGYDVAAGAEAAERRRVVAERRTIEPHRDLGAPRRRRRRQEDLGAPTVVPRLEEPNAEKCAAVQPRQVLPVEDVLPDARHRRGDVATIHSERSRGRRCGNGHRRRRACPSSVTIGNGLAEPLCHQHRRRLACNRAKRRGSRRLPPPPATRDVHHSRRRSRGGAGVRSAADAFGGCVRATHASASARVVRTPSSCASSSAFRISPTRGPGR